MFKIVSLYAALLALFYVYLSFRTIGFRRRLKISVGDGANQDMLRAMRVHANFSEYVPFALILLAFLEAQGAAVNLLHGLGVVLVSARLAHAYGLHSPAASFRFRVGGVLGTMFTIVVAAVWLLGARL